MKLSSVFWSLKWEGNLSHLSSDDFINFVKFITLLDLDDIFA